MSQEEFLKSIEGGTAVRKGVLGSSLTTFKIGGEISLLIVVDTIDSLSQVVRQSARFGLKLKVIGNGSNLLIPEDGVSDIVVMLGSGFRSVSKVSANQFIFGGAAALMSVSRQVSNDGYSGLEFGAGIPASFGGAAVMNAGAHGVELSDRLSYVSVVLSCGRVERMLSKDLNFSYRHAELPVGSIVTEVALELVAGDKVGISSRCSDNLAHRKKTQPLTLPSAGSIFKNPSAHVSAGSLLENAGLKGKSVGGASVSELHANWIVNPAKTATASDVSALIDLCIQEVKTKCGIILEPEVRRW